MKLSGSETYRQLLHIWMRAGGRGGKRISFAEVAKKCDFKSRSWLSEVLQERRSLTLQSFQKLLFGMRQLPAEVLRIFEFLVYVEHPEFCTTRSSASSFGQRLAKARARAQRKFGAVADPADTRYLLTSPLFHLCFAAMGEKGKGETLEGICRKTGLSAAIAAPLLKEICESGFAFMAKDRFEAKDAHRVVEGLGSQLAFQKYLVLWLQRLTTEIGNHPILADDLYNVSTFSTQSKNGESIRKKLVESIDETVESFEDPQGDAIVSVTVVYRAENHDYLKHQK